MRLKLISVGKIKDPAVRAGVDEYAKRLGRVHPFTWTEVRKESADRPIADIRRVEGERLLAAAGDATLVALDEKGTLVDSRAFAAKLSRWIDGGARELALVVGGAYGLDAAVRAKAAWIWSLSPLTFTHQHVPLLVAEQLYRAVTILRGEPYHND